MNTTRALYQRKYGKIKYMAILGIVLVYLVSACPKLFSQKALPGLDNLIPPSPNAASLGKYADVPVSMYTGTPQIEVPVWSCQGDVLTLNISLSYHASGIKVGEIPGWTGTGWTLNAGGVITRTTRGIADDLPTGYLDVGRNYLPEVAGDLTPLAQWEPPGQSAPEKYEFLQQVSSGQLDLEPDLFFYNFNGHSGKFIFSQNGKIILIPAADIEISYSRNPVTKAIEQWTLRDASGIQYTFGTNAAIETTTPLETNGSPGKSFNSAWYLTKMEDPNHTDRINFHYIDYQSVYRYPVPYKKTGCNVPTRDELFQYTQTRINGKYLSRIDYLRGTVTFDTANLGGFPGGDITALKHIRIHYPESPGTFKVFELEYSFFPATGCGTEQDYLPPCKRLRLDKVTEYSGDLSRHKPSWQFFYDDQPLPPRGSFSQDYWGYYNGRANDHLIPALRVFNYEDRNSLPPQFNSDGRTNFERLIQLNLNLENLEFSAWEIPGADRTPDSMAMQAGILKKIVYPTGGATRFEYEPHTFSYYSRPAAKKTEIVTASHSQANEVTKTFNVAHDQFVSVVPLFYNFNNSSKGGLKNLFSLEVDIPNIPIDNGNPSPDCRVQILPAGAGATSAPLFDFTWADAQDSVAGYHTEFPVWLKKGNYKLYAYAPNPGDSVIARLSYDTTSYGDKVYPVYGNEYVKTSVQAGMIYFLDDSSYSESRRFTLTSEDDPMVTVRCYFHSKIHPNRISSATLPYPVTSIRMEKIPSGKKIFEKIYYDAYYDSIRWDSKAEEWFFSTEEQMVLTPGTYELSFLPRIYTEYGMGRIIYRKAVATHNWVRAGGVRVKKITTTDHGKDTIGLREYSYSMNRTDPGHTSGILLNFPHYYEPLMPLYYFPKEYGPVHYSCIPVNVFSSGKIVLGSTAGSHIGYAKVTEIQPGNGWTEYEYTSPWDIPDITSTRFPFVPVTAVDWQRGLLKRKRVYNESGRLRLEELHTYHLPGLEQDSLFFSRVPAIKVSPKIPGAVYSNMWRGYFTQSGWSFPESRTTRYYGADGSPPLEQREQYAYSLNNLMVREVRKTNSDGSLQIEKTKFSADLIPGTPLADTLLARNMDDLVIRTETLRDSVLTDASENFYTLSGDGARVLKDSLRILDGDTFRTLVVFDRYDAKGHILQAHQPGGAYQSYHWNDFGLPVVRVNNSEYHNDLNAYPGSAQMTRYTYDVLAGMTSVTDPNNRTTTYEYDPLGRLVAARDPGHRIMKTNLYHYQKYEGDTTRKYFAPEEHIWSEAAEAIICADTPVVRSCGVLLTPSGGKLGTRASWHWYRDACGSQPLGTGDSLWYIPETSSTLYLRAEGKINTTSCVSLQVRVVEPAFHPSTDTIIIPYGGTTAHPVLFRHGYTGCDPLNLKQEGNWFSVIEENADNLSFGAAPNQSGDTLRGRVILSSIIGNLIIPIQQLPTPVMSVDITWTPSFLQAGDDVACTATVTGGEAPYGYVWEILPEGASDWSLVEKHLNSTNQTDQITLTVGSVNFDLRCRVTSGGETVEKIVRIPVAQ